LPTSLIGVKGLTILFLGLRSRVGVVVQASASYIANFSGLLFQVQASAFPVYVTFQPKVIIITSLWKNAVNLPKGGKTQTIYLNISTLSEYNFPATSVQWIVPKTDQWQEFSNTFSYCPPHKLLREGQN
jgi:hypothetical protein